MHPILSVTQAARLAFWILFTPMSRWGRGLEKTIEVVLLFSLPLLSNPASAEPMSFRLVSAANSDRCFSACRALIVADGEITDATPQRFLAFLRENLLAHHARVLVFINSPGGKIVAGMEIGKIFRKIGVTAVVDRLAQGQEGASEPVGGICFSACVYAFMGAKTRIVPSRKQDRDTSHVRP